MNLSELVVVCDGYKILDFISDIGGMQGMLISAFSLLLMIWNYNNLDNFLLSRLYRLGKTEDASASLAFVPEKLSNPGDYICKQLPRKL